MRSEHPRTWDESDAFSRWCRKYLPSLSRPGVTRAVKRRSHRIDRRLAKREIRSQLEDM